MNGCNVETTELVHKLNKSVNSGMNSNYRLSQGTGMDQGITTGWESLPPRGELENWWRNLESRADTTFFTSWSWIGAWLDILPANLQPKLLTAKQNGKLLGLGLVIQGRSKLMKLIPVKCWRLHSTGVEEFDDLTIEYNGFLADRQHAPAVKQAMLDFLLFKTGVGRLEITKAESAFANLASNAAKGLRVRSAGMDSYVVDLEKARQTPDGYLSLLSANTRSQVRRSLSGYRKVGNVTIHQAENLEQAKAYFTALRTWHEKTWDSRGEESGFATSEFAYEFHQRLIDSSFERGEVQLLRIAVGDTDLGYLYNFMHRGRVVFYQSGFNYGILEKQDRPGLVCHALAVEHNIAAGQHWYDFTAGNYRYKASLATHVEPQGMHIFQRDGVLPLLEAILLKVKGRLSQMQQRSHTMAWSVLTSSLLSVLHADTLELSLLMRL